MTHEGDDSDNVKTLRRDIDKLETRHETLLDDHGKKIKDLEDARVRTEELFKTSFKTSEKLEATIKERFDALDTRLDSDSQKYVTKEILAVKEKDGRFKSLFWSLVGTLFGIVATSVFLGIISSINPNP